MSRLIPSRVNISARDKWRGILEEVEKREIPVEIIDRVTVNLIDGTQVDIDVKDLINDGGDPQDIEDHLNKSLTNLDSYIEDVDFHINIDSVVETIQPMTDKILRNL